jgi:CubicO group peptidase (beta-lactamase class C family)
MRRTVLVLATLAAISALAVAQPDPRQRRIRAVEGLVETTGEDAVRQFVETHLAPSYREATPPADVVARLRAIREACAGFGGVLAQRTGDGAVRLTFERESGQCAVVVRLEPQEPFQIVALELEAAGAGTSRPQVEPLAWATLDARLRAAVESGFAGTVLVVRAGKVVLHEGYGLADREKRVPNTTGTIYAIGSVPIDFTRAAILKLEQDGKLRTSDPVAAHVPGVPSDKRAITIDHLMSGRSGLPDFHHVAGVDADRDLSWIDRGEAVRRILGHELLFKPGEGRAHSHSAWVLLAAVVEIVSKQPYGVYLREQFFVPAAMTRTGLHEDAADIDDREFAVGYGHDRAGSLNIPKHWGRTSWLVMGSGGMQSTPQDLHRWLEAIRGRQTLSAAAAAKYWKGGALAGGDDRGFFCLYTEGPGDLMILCSNAHTGPGDVVSAVGRRLVELVMPRPVAGPGSPHP